VLFVYAEAEARSGRRRRVPDEHKRPHCRPNLSAAYHFPSLLDQGEHAQDVHLLHAAAHPVVCGPGTLSSPPKPSNWAGHSGLDGEPYREDTQKQKLLGTNFKEIGYSQKS